MKGLFSWIILTLLLAGAFSQILNSRLVWAQPETIHINNDGSVTPSSAPISSSDNVTYFSLETSVPLPTVELLLKEVI